MKLQDHFQRQAVYGTHRTAVLLKGDVPIRRLCQALKYRIQGYVGRGVHRIVWMRLPDGIVLTVAGSRIAVEVVEKFLAGYPDAFQEFQLVYLGVGSKRFTDAVAAYLSRRLLGPGKSFAYSRPKLSG